MKMKAAVKSKALRPVQKQGNKHPNLGLIPNGWEVIRLSNLCVNFKSGLGITSKHISNDGEYPVYGGNGLRGFANNYTHNGTFLLIGRQGALCGNITLVHGKNYISEHAIAVQTNKENDISFLAYELDFLNLNRHSESSAQPGLSVEKLVRLKILRPPLPEQQKIARILSTWDKAIEKTELLIAQKQQLKKGLMQQLLTGKVRFKEFVKSKKMKKTKLGLVPEDWELKLFSDVSDITRLAGYEYSEYWQESDDGEIIALRGYNIGKGKLVLEDVARITNDLSVRLIRSRLSKGDIVYPCVGTIGNAAVIEVDNKYHIQQNIAKITCKLNCDPYFLSQFLMSKISLDEVKRFNATTSQPNVLVGSLREYRLRLPPILEQKKISLALISLDKQMETLTVHLDVLKVQKKGLMQKLLTGQVRVKL